ncbi:LysM peptidoglycan-binding domain-containing protein [Niallia sp. XMNu-256]|uniref:C40 family peptidase n=1 Tax=Niallia sp. XMNu-256 TaxID=3082444 RepID=UPI0030D3CB46
MKNKVATFATVAIVSSAFGATTAFADSDTYTVEKGDTLSQLAQRFNTTVSNLKQWNGLKSDRIYVNQSLIISEPSSGQSQRTTVKAATTNTSAETYTVVRGDTLLKIANNHGVSLAELVTWNNIKGHLIYPGQVLKVNGSGSAVASQPTTAKTASAPSKGNSSTYKIQSGDTLGKIAKQFDMTIAELKTLNNLKSDLIYAGATLRVSGQGAPSQPAQTVSIQAEKSVATPTTDNAKTDTYVIKSGDTLGKIASKFNTSVSNLKSLNGLRSDLIFVGQKLKVTGTAPASSVNKVSSAEIEHTSKRIESKASTSVSSVVDSAKKLIGVPYKWGGNSPSGFDCSGFIYYVFNNAGYDISRTSAQGYFDRSYEVSQPQLGDLVFFENTYKKGISHLGIYVGNNSFIHASSSGVTITSLSTSYWKDRFVEFKRFY